MHPINWSFITIQSYCHCPKLHVLFACNALAKAQSIILRVVALWLCLICFARACCRPIIISWFEGGSWLGLIWQKEGSVCWYNNQGLHQMLDLRWNWSWCVKSFRLRNLLRGATIPLPQSLRGAGGRPRTGGRRYSWEESVTCGRSRSPSKSN